MAAFAAFRHDITVVTLLPTLDEEGVKHGIIESKIEVIITSQELLAKLDVRVSLVNERKVSFRDFRLENIGFNGESPSYRLLSRS